MGFFFSDSALLCKSGNPSGSYRVYEFEECHHRALVLQNGAGEQGCAGVLAYPLLPGL